MKSFQEFLNETSKYKIYMINNTLWVAYGNGSGTTTQLTSLKTYLIDNSDDSHFDSIVLQFVKATQDMTPLKSKGNQAIFELPMYKLADLQNNYGSKIQAWGGTIKPFKTNYFCFTKEKYNVVTFFESKTEALNWLKFTD